jgi:hypothetical protein
MTGGSGAWDVDIESNNSFPTNTWTHVAIERYGNIWTLYINGIAQTDSVTKAGTVPSGTNVLWIGQANNSFYFPGWMDEFRFSKGIARYENTNFTPSTNPYNLIENNIIILSANVWESFDLDISSISNIDKNLIDRIIITLIETSAQDTFYLDNLYAWNILEYIDTETLTLSDELETNLSLEKVIQSETITLTDEEHLANLIIIPEQDDNFSINDIVELNQIRKVEPNENIDIADEIELNVSLEKEIDTDSLSLSDSIFLQLQETYDLINNFNLVKREFIDIDNKVCICKQVLSNILNLFSIVYSNTVNIKQWIYTKCLNTYDIQNDIRTDTSHGTTFDIPPYSTSLPACEATVS